MTAYGDRVLPAGSQRRACGDARLAGSAAPEGQLTVRAEVRPAGRSSSRLLLDVNGTSPRGRGGRRCISMPLLYA
jgi:hypothetical protein